jgi:hypothetical protein
MAKQPKARQAKSQARISKFYELSTRWVGGWIGVCVCVCGRGGGGGGGRRHLSGCAPPHAPACLGSDTPSACLSLYVAQRAFISSSMTAAQGHTQQWLLTWHVLHAAVPLRPHPAFPLSHPPTRLPARLHASTGPRTCRWLTPRLTLVP